VFYHIKGKVREREQRTEFLRFQINEIEAASFRMMRSGSSKMSAPFS